MHLLSPTLITQFTTTLIHPGDGTAVSPLLTVAEPSGDYRNHVGQRIGGDV